MPLQEPLYHRNEFCEAHHIAHMGVLDIESERFHGFEEFMERFHKLFKWLKQYLKIKRFWGTSENAVKIQIYFAIWAYCLVAMVQHDMLLNPSTYEVLQIIGVSLTDSTLLRDLFDKTKSQNLNVLSDQMMDRIFLIFNQLLFYGTLVSKIRL